MMQTPTEARRKNTEDSSYSVSVSDHEYDPRDSPRLLGYIGIMICSIVSFASVADVPEAYINGSRDQNISLMFGALSFVVSFIVVVLHYLSIGRVLFVKRGSGIEGLLLIVAILWWIPGVGYMTRVGGVAYQALNIYFSSWGALLWSFHTLNAWFSSRGNISAKDLTSYAQTLPGWFFLLFSSLVQFGSAVDAYKNMDFSVSLRGKFCVSVGALSSFISLIVIMSYFRMCGPLGPLIHGTSFQFIISILLVIWWTVAVAILTQSGEIGSVLGMGCYNEYGRPESRDGSNLFFALWAGFFSACNIVVKWRSTNVGDLTLRSQPQSSPRMNMDDIQITHLADDDI